MSGDGTRPSAWRRRAPLLLVVPVLAWLFPWVYARATPKLGPFTFFLWYQFAAAVGTALTIAAVYLLRERGDGA